MSAAGFEADRWRYWQEGRESVRVLDVSRLWGRERCDVVVPSTGRVQGLAAAELRDAASRPWSAAEISWRASAAVAARLVAGPELPRFGSENLEPLPHQVAVLERALRCAPVRLLLADEVGLGKTIEAGLIFKSLQARGVVTRVLVVAPKGVQLQWVAEMRDHFGEDFARVGPGAIPLDTGVDVWRAFDRVVCSLDTVKPLRRRAGWSEAEIADHNEQRFRNLVDAGWDLVIIDEAHHVAGSSADVARHRLARELADTTEHILLLSATPHSGKTDAFTRLLSLLDAQIGSGAPLRPEWVRPLVVRTEKRDTTDSAGRALFAPRSTSLTVVGYGHRRVEAALYDSVTEYVKHGYDRARRERRQAMGFLVLLMQRLVSSSTAAILSALERRSAALTAVDTQLQLFADRSEEWAELTGEEQFEALEQARGAAWGDERAEVDLLLDLARKAAGDGRDAKATYLLELLCRLEREEGDPSLKAVVFTEFVPTQQMLLDMFAAAGITAVGINGTMSIDERHHAQEEFRQNARVLVSTDAGGEGVNLQHAHVVVNYDVPWSPTRLEQRIGRVDRIGQRHAVRAFNLVLENSVDQRVLSVLEEKLRRILAELGADKAGDVLESTDHRIQGIYADAIVTPEQFPAEIDGILEAAREDVQRADSVRALLGASVAPKKSAVKDLDPVLDDMVRHYTTWSGVRPDDALALLDALPVVCPADPVPVAYGLESGLWSLWEVWPDSGRRARDCFALFVNSDGVVRPDIAERVWHHLRNVEAVSTTDPLTPSQWEDLVSLGADYAYRPLQELAPDGPGDAPELVLRLVVETRP